MARAAQMGVAEAHDGVVLVTVAGAIIVGTAKKAERYKSLLARHLETIYPYAKLVNNAEVPKNATDLKAKILRPMEATLMATTLSTAETKVKEYLERQPHDVSVEDVVRNFAKAPPVGLIEVNSKSATSFGCAAIALIVIALPDATDVPIGLSPQCDFDRSQLIDLPVPIVIHFHHNWLLFHTFSFFSRELSC